MPHHRLIKATFLPELITVEPPFSSFDFIEKHYGDFNSLRRLFSIARAHEFKTISIENIHADGIIKEENEDIISVFPDYKMGSLQRLVFWNVVLSRHDDITNLSNENIIGYAIIKHDIIPGKRSKWHVFESVLRKYRHEHNCIPIIRNYEIQIAYQKFNTTGIMYCQQNSLNKSCAQVALRSLLDGLPNIGTLSYRKINKLAGNQNTPGDGFGVEQIRKVLTNLNISFRDIDYSNSYSMRKTHPYTKFVYSGVESGIGALLGFRFSQPGVAKE